MLYPKNKVMELSANLIGSNVVYGVHWFIFQEEPSIEKAIQDLKKLILSSNGSIETVFTTKSLNNKELVIFNSNIIEEVSNEAIERLYINNPGFPRLHSLLNFEEIKNKEIANLIDYINSREVNEFDIYLYKCSGLRSNTLNIQDDKNNSFQKTIFGFYLTEEDLEKVNSKLVRQKNKKKIIWTQEKECLAKDFGIRYTLRVE